MRKRTSTERVTNGKPSAAILIPTEGEELAVGGMSGPTPIDPSELSNGHRVVPDCSAEIEVVRLPIGILKSAGEQYQRPVDWKRVDRLVERFRLQSLSTFLINQRPDGDYWIVDGQHRKEACEKLFGKEFEWWCFLVHVAGPPEEAAIFVEVNAEHARPAPGVLFQGRLIRGEAAALEIERIVLEYGLSLHLSSGREAVKEVPTAVLDAVYSKWGGQRLREVLKFSNETWSEQKGCHSSAVITGISTFFQHYRDQKTFDQERISKTLADVQVQYVYRESKLISGREGCHRHVAFARAMQQLYNSHCDIPNQRLARKKEGSKKQQ